MWTDSWRGSCGRSKVSTKCRDLSLSDVGHSCFNIARKRVPTRVAEFLLQKYLLLLQLDTSSLRINYLTNGFLSFSHVPLRDRRNLKLGSSCATLRICLHFRENNHLLSTYLNIAKLLTLKELGQCKYL